MIALVVAAALCLAPPAQEMRRLTTADPFLTIMADPDAAAIVMKHAPYYVRLIDQQVVPPPSPELTLDDFLDIPATQVTAEDLRRINEALAKLPARELPSQNRTQ